MVRKQSFGLVFGPLAAVGVYMTPFPTLGDGAHTLAAILAWVVVFWITEPVPLPVTALLGSSFCVLAGLGSAKEVFASYAHPIIFLFIGSFFLAEALAVHGVDRRFATRILSLPWVGTNAVRIFFAMGTVTAVISMWISNTAAAALMLPISMGVLSTLRESTPEKSLGRYETGLMLMLAYGSGVGGVATVIGTPPNLIGVGLLDQQANIRVPFFTWMAIGLPLSLLMLLVVWSFLLWLHPAPPALPGLDRRLRAQRDALGPWTRAQLNACLAFGLAVTLWITPGILSAVLGAKSPPVLWLNTHLPKELVAVFAASLLFILPTQRPIRWRAEDFTLSWDRASNIHWGTILLFGGGLSFGHLMGETGLANRIGQEFVSLFGVQAVWSLTAVAIVTGVLLTELASNTAAASMLVPVIIAIAQSAGVSPVPPTLGACMGASLAFVLPVSTPPNAIVYGTGLVPIASMVRAGVLLDIVGAITIWIALRLLCPLLGLD